MLEELATIGQLLRLHRATTDAALEFGNDRFGHLLIAASFVFLKALVQ
jgi:hypothetical protein